MTALNKSNVQEALPLLNTLRTLQHNYNHSNEMLRGFSISIEESLVTEIPKIHNILLLLVMFVKMILDLIHCVEEYQ
ncbi:MAG: hypothetical protein DRO14_05730 [Thermoprotei archaeon]|nr:MAG: hypothetical protein DRO14_05730 [Thermoprotei archaeon]